MNSSIKVIAFDADDTLFKNEDYFQEARVKFEQILSEYSIKNLQEKLLYKQQTNLKDLGYGIKPTVMAMADVAIEETNGKINSEKIGDILNIAKDIAAKPIELLSGVKETLKQLYNQYKLVVITKGDLLDQENKIKNSGLNKYFDHIFVVSEKDKRNYKRICEQLNILPNNLLMIGNSLKSDIIPAINIGAHAIHIPYSITWEHEKISNNFNSDNFYKIKKITEILDCQF